MNDQRLAFVIMPFEDDFNSVYGEFIRPALEGAGFVVQRADDIESQQNILRDIVGALHRSDLIVADLTSMNPNVFYELGLAHAFRKSVILITQSIEEVPFDLRSQRLLVYSTHFAEIGAAREELDQYARRALEGSLQFGSPVTDFLASEVDSPPVVAGRDSPDDDQDERGFIDHLVEINEGYQRIAGIAEEVGRELQDLNESTERTSEDFRRLGVNPNSSTPVAVRRASRRLAEHYTTFNDRLSEANTEYRTIAQGIEDSLEYVVSFQREHSEESSQEIDEQLSTLGELRSVVQECRISVLSLADIMDGLPRLERQLNREVTRGSRELRTMANNLDITVASISRALGDHA